ncbi:50S ribosomal protein L13 [Patescibacteria group bacterium]|nr:50S ribosomal protein L13 [Patescibacteria group bacterium]
MQREIYKIDATDKSLGRIATDIAMHLMGKHKPDFQSNIDSGDFVEVENIAKVKITGKKLDQKEYYHHTFFPGGLKTMPMRKLFEKDPAEVLRKSVSRMLPKTKHRTERIKRLKIS